MAFTLIGDEWRDDVRLIDAGPQGRDFFWQALFFCNVRRSDGRIRDADLGFIAPGQRYPKKLALRLADLGLFRRVAGGYLIPPELYRCFNRFKAELGRDRRKNRTSLKTERPLTEPSTPRVPLDAESAPARFHANPMEPGPFDVNGDIPRPAPPAPHPVAPATAEEVPRSIDDLLATADVYEKLGHHELAQARRQLAKAMGRSEDSQDEHLGKEHSA